MQHPKGVLIERVKQLGLGKAEFATHNSGPDHEPTFETVITVSGNIYGEGKGSTKRDAERKASEEALAAIENLDQEAAPRRGRSSRSARNGQRTEAGEAVQSLELEGFEGPWPIFPKVLASSLEVAHARVNPTLMGEAAILEIQALALHLYKGSLQALGEVVEIELEDEDEAQ